jgi:hypothetical protein
MKKISFAFLAVLAVGLVFLSLLTPQPIFFRDVGEASRCIQAAGYCVTSDRTDGVIQSGFLVTTQEATWEDANNLCKIGKMGPEWKGRVWVSQLAPGFCLGTLPDDAKPRTWGDVCAFGDPVLLEQLEDKLRGVHTNI